MKPWEKYQAETQAEEPQGPWSKYKAPAAEQPTDDSAMAWVNKGIANAGDFMADAVWAAPNAIIRGASNVAGVEDPFQFKVDRGANVMDSVGIPVAMGDPETYGQRALMGAGEGLSYLLPGTAIAKGLKGASGPAGWVGRNLGINSKAAAGLEVSANAGSRVGEQAAVDMSGSDNGLVRVGGQIAGAVAGAMAPGAIGRTARTVGPSIVTGIPFVERLGNAALRQLTPFTDAGGMRIASDRLRSLSQDPDAQALMIKNDSPLSPAQQTGDPNLLALENRIIQENPQMQKAYQDNILASQRQLTDEAYQGTVPVDELQGFISSRLNQTNKNMQAHVEAARARAQERIAKLEPNARPEVNSMIVREELDKAYEIAKAGEQAAWSQVPRDAIVDTTNAHRSYADELDRATIVRQDQIPVNARVLLGENADQIGDRFLRDAFDGPPVAGRDSPGLGQMARSDEMMALRSRMLEASRNARSGDNPSAFTASSAENISEGVLKDMDAAGLGPAYQQARSTTANVKQTFDQGNVLTARGTSANGANRVAPEQVLDRTIGTGGTRGAVAIDDFRRAAGNVIDEPVADYILGRVARAGDFSPTRVDRFMTKNPEIMDRLPVLADDLRGASTAAKTADSRAARYGETGKALNDPRQSVAAAVSNAKSGQEVSAIFNAKNPVEYARQIALQASKDTTGNATMGLKGGLVDDLFTRAGGEFTDNGEKLINGTTLNGLLKDPKTRPVFEAVFDNVEMSRLDSITSQLQKSHAARTSNAVGEIVDVQPNKIISAIGGVLSARGGSTLGKGTSGASLKTSAMATKRWNDFLFNLTRNKGSEILTKAATDPELYRRLMTGKLETDKDLVEATSYLAGKFGVTLQGTLTSVATGQNGEDE